MGSVYTPRKLGVRFNPPTLILIYEDSVPEQLRRRSMPIRHFVANPNVREVAERLKLRHKDYMHSVPQVLVEKMLRLVQIRMTGLDLEGALSRVEMEFDVGPDDDLNTLPDEVVARKKAMMEVAFNKKRLNPGEPGFKYDKRMDFQQPKTRSEWDDMTPPSDEETECEPEQTTNVDDLDDFWD